jgi:hypothetical protein
MQLEAHELIADGMPMPGSFKCVCVCACVIVLVLNEFARPHLVAQLVVCRAHVGLRAAGAVGRLLGQYMYVMCACA